MVYPLTMKFDNIMAYLHSNFFSSLFLMGKFPKNCIIYMAQSQSLTSLWESLLRIVFQEGFWESWVQKSLENHSEI